MRSPRAAGSRRERHGAAALRGPRHRHRHRARASRASCSRPSSRPTARPADTTAAAGSAWRSASGWSGDGRDDRGRERARPRQHLLVRGAVPARRPEPRWCKRARTSRRASGRCGCWWPTTWRQTGSMLEAMLGRHGHEVLLAEDGAAAVELAARESARRGADGRADAGDGRDGGDPADPPAAAACRRGADPRADRQRHGEPSASATSRPAWTDA